MKYFISDLHLGCGDALEDFIIHEKHLPEEKALRTVRKGISGMHRKFQTFIEHIITENSRNDPEFELILLGDIFDLLQVLPGSRNNPAKIRMIYKVHEDFFKSLKLLNRRGGRITFIIGNHDHDLVYPEMWAELRKFLPFINRGARKKPLLYYHSEKAGIYAEHGNQLDSLNSFEDPYDAEEWPFGSEMVRRIINPLEKMHPMVDNLHPRQALWYILRRLPAIIDSTQRDAMQLEKEITGITPDNRLKHLAWLIVHRCHMREAEAFFRPLWKLLTFMEKNLRKASSLGDGFEGILFLFNTIGRNPLRVFQELLIDRQIHAAREIVNGKYSHAIGFPEKPPQHVIFGHTHRPLLKRLGESRTFANSGSWKARVRPFGRNGFQYEQPLDYIQAGKSKTGRWHLKRKQWINYS